VNDVLKGAKSKELLDNCFLYMKLLFRGLHALQAAGRVLFAGTAYRSIALEGDPNLKSQNYQYRKSFTVCGLFTAPRLVKASLAPTTVDKTADRIIFELYEVTGLHQSHISGDAKDNELLLAWFFISSRSGNQRILSANWSSLWAPMF
jgi:hypothetical protein